MATSPAAAPTFVDLFSGCGGASLGFLEAGYRCLLAVDFDQAAVNCYNANLKGPQDAGAVQHDLGALDSHQAVLDFLAANNVDPTGCDALVGGPPCQSFSVVGRNKIRALIASDAELQKTWETTNQKRTMLFEAYALFLEAVAPRWFFFENVPAIRSHENYQLIEARFNSLKRPDGSLLSYRIFPGTYWASDYGVPQRRRRFIMVGYREDLNLPGWLPPLRLKGPNVGDALDDLPEVPSGYQKARTEYFRTPATAFQKLMRAGVDRKTRRIVFNHMCRDNNADDVALFARMKPGARFSDPEVQQAIREINPEHKLLKYSIDKFRDKLHKLDDQQPAWTVTAHLQKDCYKFIHHRQARTITVREAARLQSFPDRFLFPNVLGPSFRLIGNAVPPLLAQAFAESFLASDPQLAQKLDLVRRTVPGFLWLQIAPMLEQSVPSTGRGRPPVPLRSVVVAGLKVELEGADWDDVVAELNGAKTSTYKRHLQFLKYAGSWARLLSVLRKQVVPSTEQVVLPLA